MDLNNNEMDLNNDDINNPTEAEVRTNVLNNYLKGMSFLKIVASIVLGMIGTYIFSRFIGRNLIANNKTTDTVMWVLLISTLVLAVLMTLIIYFISTDKADKREILRSTYGYKDILITIIPFYIGILVNIVYNLILNLISKDLANTLGRDDFSQMLAYGPITIKGLIPLFISLVILAPIYEELIFRGVIFNFLHKKVGVLLSALISSGIFGILHGNTFFQTTVLGFILALIYHYSGDIKFSMIAHAINNLFAFMSMVIFTKTNGNEEATEFLVLGSVMMIGAVIAVFAFYKFIKKVNFKENYYNVTPIYRNDYMELINEDYNKM